MSRSEVTEVLEESSALQSSQHPLPLYVEPAPEEALFSWLLRLATRLEVSLDALARVSFGVDDHLGHTHWWRRPRPWLLERIAASTGVSLARLQHMTLEGLEPYRDDEATARFAGKRYEATTPLWRRHCFAVCGPCLAGDATPYLRTSWLIGWMAVCAHHGTVLIECCRACGAGLRVARFVSTASFSPLTCARCGHSLLDDGHRAAHPSVAQLQAALWRGKCAGITRLAGLGRLTWKEIVSLADVLIGMVWTELTPTEREEIFRLYIGDPHIHPTAQDAIHEGRYGSLQFLAWLTDGWPESPGAQVSQSMLIRWLMLDSNCLYGDAPPLFADLWSVNPRNFEPRIRRRLRALAGAA